MVNQFSDDPNPFASPAAVSHFAPPPRKSGMPTFSRVMFIVSLVFAAFRLISVPFAIMGFLMMQRDGNPMMASAMGEIATAVGIAFCGTVGNGLMLAGKKFGLYLGYALVLFVIGSLGVGLSQAGMVLGQFPEGSSERIGAMIGMGGAMLFRVILLGLYVYALIGFSGWVNRQPAEM